MIAEAARIVPRAILPARPAAHTRNRVSVLTMATWIARLAVCVVVGVLTFVTDPATGTDLVLAITAFLLCTGIYAYWLMTDAQAADRRRRELTVARGVMAAVASLTCVAPHGSAFIVFSVVGVFTAAPDTGRFADWVVTAIAFMCIEVGALIFSTDTTAVWGCC